MRTRVSMVAGMLILLSWLGACSSSSDSGSSGSGSSGSGSSDSGSSASSPSGEGATSAAIEVVPAREPVGRAFADTAIRLGVPGAFLLIRTPAGEERYAFGTAVVGTQASPRQNMHFRIGSNTKVMTGTVILQLVRDGKLSLDTRLAAYYPTAPNAELITIEMLLAMRSGLFNYTEDEAWLKEAGADPQRGWSSTELIEIGIAHAPLFAPGAEFSYSNTNTVLLAHIAELIEHKPMATIVQERLLSPLGLDETRWPSDGAMPEPFAHGYLFAPSLAEDPTANQLEEYAGGVLPPTDVTSHNPSWANAAGIVVSTAGDMADWMAAVIERGDDLIGKELANKRLASAGDGAYGLALFNFGGYLGHNGGLPGFQSFAVHNPVSHTTVVIWANVQEAVDGTAPADAMFAAIRPLLD